MTYDEAIEATVTQAEAIREIRLYGVDEEDFFEEYGVHAEYNGRDVLEWLGY